MIRIKNIPILIIALMLPFLSCMKDDTEGENCSVDGTKIVLSIGDPTEVETRSEATTNERRIEDCFLLVFSGSGDYIKGESVDLSNITNNGAQQVTLHTAMPLEAGNKIVVLINSKQDNPSINPMQAGDKIENINTRFGDISLAKFRNPATTGQGLPMSGEMEWDGNNKTCKIYRSVAKVQLIVDNDVTGEYADNLKVDCEWGVLSNLYAPIYSKYGDKAYPTNLDPMNWGFFSPNSGAAYVPEYHYAGTADATTHDYERRCLFLQCNNNDGDPATTRWYRIDFYDHINKKYLSDINRNYHYIITVKKVNSDGYSTMSAAILNPGSNLEYEIKVVGDNDNVVVSNGQYAVALEYDELIAMAEFEQEFKVKAKYILPAEVTTPPSTNNIVVSSGVTITNSVTTLTPTEQEIKFKSTVQDGTISFKFGNITKVLNIKQRLPLDAHYNSMSFNGDFSEVQWVERNDNISILPSSTKMVITSAENVTPTGWIARNDDGTYSISQATNNDAVPTFSMLKSMAYVLDSKGLHRTKVYIEQYPPIYLGYLGSPDDIANPGVDNDADGYARKRMVMEYVEEQTELPFYTIATLFRQQNHYDGKGNTKEIVESGGFVTGTAAYSCYMKNDKNGNGTIDADEPILWYLPSNRQILSFWGVNGPPYLNGNLHPADYEYWSSTEGSAAGAYTITMGDGSTYGWVDKTSGTQKTIRCVRDL